MKAAYAIERERERELETGRQWQRQRRRAVWRSSNQRDRAPSCVAETTIEVEIGDEGNRGYCAWVGFPLSLLVQDFNVQFSNFLNCLLRVAR